MSACTHRSRYRCQRCDVPVCFDCYTSLPAPEWYEREWKTIGNHYCDAEACTEAEAAVHRLPLAVVLGWWVGRRFAVSGDGTGRLYVVCRETGASCMCMTAAQDLAVPFWNQRRHAILAIDPQLGGYVPQPGDFAKFEPATPTC